MRNPLSPMRVAQGRGRGSGKNASPHGFRIVKAGDLAAGRGSGVCAGAGKSLMRRALGLRRADFAAFPNRGRIVAKPFMAMTQLRRVAQPQVKAGVIAL